VLNLQKTPRKTAKIWEMNLEELKDKGLFMPPVEKKYLELPEPTSQDNLPDVTRLISFLKAKHDEHRLVVELPVIRNISDILRQGDFKVTATLARPVQSGRKTHIIHIQSGDTTDRNYAIAVDVGTTTVYAQLVDLITGDILAQFGDYNGQISYGEDIISRIVYAGKPGGLEKLQEVVIATVNKLIKKMVKKARIDPDEISTITMAGNTTMTQLMLRVNPKYIRLSPYVPASTLYPPIKAIDLGLALGDHVTALVYPAISSYVAWLVSWDQECIARKNSHCLWISEPMPKLSSETKIGWPVPPVPQVRHLRVVGLSLACGLLKAPLRIFPWILYRLSR